MNPDFNYAEYQFFPTPYNLAVAISATRVASYSPRSIIDIGAGHGVWGRAVREIQEGWRGFSRLEELVAIDPMDDGTDEQAQAKQYYNFWIKGYLDEYFAGIRYGYDVAFGNPPYGDALLPVIKTSLKMADTVVFLVASTFLASLGRYNDFYSKLSEEYAVKYVCVDWIVPRPTFVKRSSNPNTEYIVLTMSKLMHDTRSSMGWLKWSRKPQDLWSYVYSQFLG